MTPLPWSTIVPLAALTVSEPSPAARTPPAAPPARASERSARTRQILGIGTRKCCRSEVCRASRKGKDFAPAAAAPLRDRGWAVSPLVALPLFAVSAALTLLAASFFADRLDHVGPALGLPEV